MNWHFRKRRNRACPGLCRKDWSEEVARHPSRFAVVVAGCVLWGFLRLAGRGGGGVKLEIMKEKAQNQIYWLFDN